MKEKKLKILSLFDGCSIGQQAIKDLRIRNYTYYASEIDKYAISITQKNFPKTIQIGDVTNVNGKDFDKVDLLIGGSPCQGFSFAGKQLNFEDPRSKLFFEYVRILKELREKNPDIKFLLENVLMKEKSIKVISDLLGQKPRMINSAIFTAQSRKRLYWTNINLPAFLPEDRGIVLKDILESGDIDRLKSYCIDANYFKGSSHENYLKKSRRQIVFVKSGNKKGYEIANEGDSIYIGYPNSNTRRGRVSKKSGTIQTICHITTLQNDQVRKLTPMECERLQGLPDNYTEGVSDTQRYKMLGNGFTRDVIEWILSHANFA